MFFRRRYIAVLLALLAFLCCCRLDSGEIKGQYKDYKAATTAHPGTWMQAILPKSATRIRERFVGETSELWIRYSFDPKDYAAVVARCKETKWAKVVVPIAELPSRFNCPGRFKVTWWPKGLAKPRKQQAPKGYRFYSCDPAASIFNMSDSYLAVDRQQSLVYYWVTRDES